MVNRESGHGSTVRQAHGKRMTDRPFDRPFGHELPSGLSLRVEDKAEWLSRAVVTQATENIVVVLKIPASLKGCCSAHSCRRRSVIF